MSRRTPRGTPHPLVAELREERIAARIPQRRVPGLNASNISQWETGVCTPSVENLVRYAHVLGYRIEFVRLDQE